MDNIIERFNRYSLYAFFVVLILPFAYLVLPKVFTSYFDAFDKLSIPLWAALYSAFSLRFTKKKKKADELVKLYKQRVAAWEKMNNEKSLNEYTSNLKILTQNESESQYFTKHIDFINEALRFSVIIGAVVKICQLLFKAFFIK